MTETAIGRRYGRALFRSALARGEADRVEQELASVRELLAGEPALAHYLDSPRVSGREKGGFLKRQLASYLLPLTLEFLQLLIEKGRLGAIEGIHAAYHRLLQEERGEVEATVVTARQVDQAVLDELVERLGRIAGKKVLLRHELDPALLGGMTVYLGETVIDGSLRHRLRRLRERLLEVRVH